VVHEAEGAVGSDYAGKDVAAEDSQVVVVAAVGDLALAAAADRVDC